MPVAAARSFVGGVTVGHAVDVDVDHAGNSHSSLILALES